MRNEKQIITVAEIRNYLRKSIIEEFIFCGIVFPVLFWLTFILKIPILIFSLIKFISLIVPCLLALWGIVKSIYGLIQIKRNAYFKIGKDTLISKAECNPFLRGSDNHSMHFGLGHYDVRLYNESDATDDLSHALYGMSIKAVWQSSFVGDSFTLVYIGKEIGLAFNDNFFEIQDDL